MIIALSGWKQSGKDTVSDYLVASKGFKRLGLADVLKDMVAGMFSIPRSSLDINSEKEQPILSMPVKLKDGFSKHLGMFLAKEFRDARGLQASGFYHAPSGELYAEPFAADRPNPLYWTPRALAILIGSVMRTANSDYWVSRICSQMKPGENYVISDLRYRSEVSALAQLSPKDQTLQVARIERFDTSPSSDPSERDLDSYPFTSRINNKKDAGVTLDALFAQVDTIIAQAAAKI